MNLLSVSDESSSDDESSSEEEEDEVKSMESMDMQPIRLDENVCPPGCDRKLYDLAFSMRTERQGYEQGIINTLKLIDDKKKEMEMKKIDMRKAEEIYNFEKGKLTEFRVSLKLFKIFSNFEIFFSYSVKNKPC